MWQHLRNSLVHTKLPTTTQMGDLLLCQSLLGTWKPQQRVVQECTQIAISSTTDLLKTHCNLHAFCASVGQNEPSYYATYMCIQLQYESWKTMQGVGQCTAPPLIFVQRILLSSMSPRVCDNKSVQLVSYPDHTSHKENGLVNQVEFLGPITGMW